jgi:hypothetical protein
METFKYKHFLLENMVRLERIVLPALALALATVQPMPEAQAFKEDSGGSYSNEPSQPDPDDVRTGCRRQPYQHVHREYGVFATDDSPVQGPELADLIFACDRFYTGPYHDYCGENRIKDADFRIGHIPEHAVTNGVPKSFSYGLRNYLHDVDDESLVDLRVALIFTGPEFDEQLEPALPFLQRGVHSESGYMVESWSTKAGMFYRITDCNFEDGESVGVLINILG